MDGSMSKEMQLIITPTKKNPFEKSKTIESLYIKNLLELKNKKRNLRHIFICVLFLTTLHLATYYENFTEIVIMFVYLTLVNQGVLISILNWKIP